MTPREMRRAAGLTQAVLAKKARLSVPTVAAIEEGDRTLTMRSVGKVAKVLGVEVHQLVEAMQAVTPRRAPRRKAVAS